jgi:hypothetical protein
MPLLDSASCHLLSDVLGFAALLGLLQINGLLFLQISSGDVLHCVVQRLSGSYVHGQRHTELGKAFLVRGIALQTDQNTHFADGFTHRRVYVPASVRTRASVFSKHASAERLPCMSPLSYPESIMRLAHGFLGCRHMGTRMSPHIRMRHVFGM